MTQKCEKDFIMKCRIALYHWQFCFEWSAVEPK